MTDNKTLRKVLLASTILSLIGSGAAVADPEDTPPLSGQETARTLDTVIVQARREDEDQQSVPIAVTTLSGDALNENTAGSISDLQRLMPSMQITLGPSGQQDFTIRGSFGALGVDPAVVTYVDDVPVNSRAIVYSLFDLESVQQLKGPQGTLFGRNSTGGAVLFVSKRPQFDETGGYVRGRVGNLKEQRAEGALNIPISANLAMRVAGEIEKRDGTSESVSVNGLDFENRDNKALRASILWQPSDKIENYTQVTHYRVRENRYANEIITLAGPCTGPTTPAVSCIYQSPFNSFFGTGDIRAYFEQQQSLPEGKTVADDPTLDNIDRDSITNTFEIDLGALSIRNISYYGDVDFAFSRDYDGTPVDIIDLYTTNHAETFYTETYAFGDLFNDLVDWRLGAVYSSEETKQSETQRIFVLPVSLTDPRTTNSRTDFKSNALFGQLTTDLSAMLSGLSLTTGYRYTWDDRKVVTSVFQGQPTVNCGLQVLPIPSTGPVAVPGADLATCSRPLSSKFEDYNYNVTLDWQAMDNLLLYVATRRGYKTGSFNLFEPNTSLAEYAPEIVEDVELGVKADWTWSGVPIRLNAALFSAEYSNIQTQTVAIDPNTGSVTILILNKDPVTGQSSLATIDGYELEVQAAPTSWLDVSAFYSKLDATYDRFIVPSSRIDLSGDSVGGVVPETFGVSAETRWALDSNIGSELSVAASYYSSSRPQSNATSLTIPDGKQSVDARISLRNIFGSSADLAIYGKNLGDEVNCATNPLVTGALTQTCPDPRTYGIELVYRFGSEAN